MSWSTSSCFCLFRRRLRSLGTEEAAGCSANAGLAGVLRSSGDFRPDSFMDLKDMVKKNLNQSTNWFFGGKSHRTFRRNIQFHNTNDLQENISAIADLFADEPKMGYTVGVSVGEKFQNQQCFSFSNGNFKISIRPQKSHGHSCEISMGKSLRFQKRKTIKFNKIGVYQGLGYRYQQKGSHHCGQRRSSHHPPQQLIKKNKG